MRRILAIALTLVMVLVALTGCMSQQISCGPEEDQNPPSKEQGSQSLNPHVPGEVIDLKINSLDKLNYFAALRTITGTPTVSKQSMTGGSFEIVLWNRCFYKGKVLEHHSVGMYKCQGYHIQNVG